MKSFARPASRFSRLINRHMDLRKRNYLNRRFDHIKWFWCRDPRRVVKDLWWWVKHRTTNRHHVVKLNGLKPGWWDTDTRILFAAFTLFEEHIEKEKPFKITEWNGDDISREYANEMHSLYLWWKRYKIETANNIDENFEEENRRYQQETDNLIRLMKVRGTLWT